MSIPGSRTGKAIADLAARARVQAREIELRAEAADRQRFLKAFMEQGERELAEPLQRLVASLLEAPDLPEELAPLLEEARRPRSQFGFLLDLAAIASAMWTFMFRAGEPLSERWVQSLWQKHPSRLPDASALAHSIRLEVDGSDDAAEMLERHGFDTAARRVIREAAVSVPAAGELLELVRRGTLPPGELDTHLRRAGLDPRYTDAVASLAERLPDATVLLEGARRGLIDDAGLDRELGRLGLSEEVRRIFTAPASPTTLGGLRFLGPTLQDFILFAAREIFEPAERARLGIDAEFPPAMAQVAAQIGLPEHWARDYWAAHWTLPGLGQGFEMLWRSVINRDELEGLFRAVEIPPLWRDRLLAISFLPYTRVDLRRLRRAGLIGRAEVYRNYLDQGYPPEKAEVLTRFAELEGSEEERGLAKGEIRSLYELQLIGRAEAAELLESLGMSDFAREMTLDLADAKRARQRLERGVTVIRSRFVARRIDRVEAGISLDRLGVAPDYRDDLITEWETLREATQVELTEAQLAGALRRGLLTAEDYVRRVIDKGYSPEDADILLGLRTAG